MSSFVLVVGSLRYKWRPESVSYQKQKEDVYNTAALSEIIPNDTCIVAQSVIFVIIFFEAGTVANPTIWSDHG